MRAILVIILFLMIIPVKGQVKPCAPVNNIPENDRAFDDGERVVYVINYTWGVIKTDVGEAVVSLKRLSDNVYGDYFHSIITGYSYKFYEMFFKVKDLFESKFNTTNGRPFYFHRDISEGRYRMKNWYKFNPDYSINANVQRLDQPSKDTLLKGRECTFDLVSLFYFSRNMDFSKILPGVEQPISFAIDDEIFDLYYRYIGPEIKRVPGMGQFRTLKFAARVVVGEVFSGKEELVIWVSDDKNRIPLMFETPIIVGKVTGRISSYKNLKHPLSSKIR
ncbi:MAG: hypothetical protein CVU13_03930 [Bacteroidetes bacterium HGW-Bacteroidetes-8]|jgi:hypothetical protein|nr:MAG: hypothetical protein CVU13_03930 [Bacteroidetes bacterium HGW-Bacteroidetes-8]